MITRRNFLKALGIGVAVGVVRPQLLLHSLEPVTFDAADMQLIAEYVQRQLHQRLGDYPKAVIESEIIVLPPPKDNYRENANDIVACNVVWDEDDHVAMKSRLDSCIDVIANSARVKKATEFLPVWGFANIDKDGIRVAVDRTVEPTFTHIRIQVKVK
jgi:hypothetical protein